VYLFVRLTIGHEVAPMRGPGDARMNDRMSCQLKKLWPYFAKLLKSEAATGISLKLECARHAVTIYCDNVLPEFYCCMSRTVNH
jgi:hypothetical protein